MRIVTATNRDLRQEVAQGNFRADLFHRLTQLELKVPPLRDRREEIGDLARFFLSQHSRPVKLSDGALRALTAYPWPGNLRELRNIVIRAAILTASEVLHVEDLDLPRATVLEMPSRQGPVLSESSRIREDGPEPGAALDEMEKRMILEALRKTDGHHQRAAEMLGISRRTLSRKLKVYETAVEQLA